MNTKLYTREDAARMLLEPTDAPNGAFDSTIATRFSHNHDVSAFQEIATARYEMNMQTSPLFQPIDTPISMPKSSKSHPVFESYVKPDATYEQMQNVVPTSTPRPTFRPVIFDNDLNAVEAHQDQPKPEMEQYQKIAEVNIASKDVHATNDTDNENMTMRLNARGLIAVAAFVAVMILTVTLIIINAVSLGNSGARIDALRTENAVLSARYTDLSAERHEAFDYVTRQIIQRFDGEQFVQVQSTPVTPTVPWQFPVEDTTTNWFDRVSNFFSGLFR